jgi:hypothetical protein
VSQRPVRHALRLVALGLLLGVLLYVGYLAAAAVT